MDTITDPAVKIKVPDAVTRLLRNLAAGARGIIPRVETPAERLRREGEDVIPRLNAERARVAMERLRAKFNEEITDAVDKLTSGYWSPSLFRAKMTSEIRMLLFSSKAAAVGGVGYLTPEDIADVDARVKEQTEKYLEPWIAALQKAPKDDPLWSPGRLRTRALMYGGVDGAAYAEAEDKTKFREFPNLPFYPKEKTDCLNNCKCRWEWTSVDRENGNADVYWRLGVAEHCEVCKARAKAFSPLRIRAFKFENMPPDLAPFLTKRRR